MPMTDDELIKKLRRLDPADRGELARAGEGDDAARLLARVLATDPAAEEGAPLRDRPRRIPRPALAGLAGLAALAALVLLLVGLPGGGEAGGGDRLAGALDQAAAVAASQPRAGVPRPWSYLKTREVQVSASGSNGRAWHVAQVTTREEWMSPDGPGQMRIAAGPTRFVDSRDRSEWEDAGKPSFLPLGFGPRTEVHWFAGAMTRERVAELPVDPAALARRLRREAAGEGGELPLPAATLQLIAEDLRSPAASPRLRQALFEAVKLVPGVRYFAGRTQVGGSRGVAVGVSGLGPDGKAQFALIFDPSTARPLATREILPTGAGAGPTIERATVFLEAPTVDPPEWKGSV
jgi:hypothetical protein